MKVHRINPLLEEFPIFLSGNAPWFHQTQDKYCVNGLNKITLSI